MAKLETLPEDIYSLFDPDKHHELNEDNLNEFAENVKQLLRDRLAKAGERSSTLRFSSLGKPDRQMWYEAHPEEGMKEAMTPKTYLKFMYGDVIEQLLLLFTKEAGHEVTHEQAEVEVDGVLGHIDAIIDGVVVDVKSASPFGYKKFAERRVTEDDPFGYVAQLSGYADVLTPGQGAAWLAIDKVGGDICVSPLSSTVIKHYPPLDRIQHLREVVANEEPPQRCHQPIPDGKSGNLKLPTPCSYCAHKHRCHTGLRTFLYSAGPRFLTQVGKIPEVPEVQGVVSDEG